MKELKSLQSYRVIRDAEKNKLARAENEVRKCRGRVLNCHDVYLLAIQNEAAAEVKKTYQKENEAAEALILAESKVKALKEISSQKKRKSPEYAAAAGAVNSEALEILADYKEQQRIIKNELHEMISKYKQGLQAFQTIADQGNNLKALLKDEGLNTNRLPGLLFAGELPDLSWM